MISTGRLPETARPPRGSPDVRGGRQSTPYTADGRPPPATCRRSGQGSGVALGGVAYMLWSRAGGVCCVEGLLAHSLRFRPVSYTHLTLPTKLEV